MKRKYEVAYYEYGLTRLKSKRFFLFTAACIYKMYLDRKYNKSAYAVIRELR